MIAAFLLLGAVLGGVALVRWFFRATLNWVELTLWGLVIGWSLMTVIAYGLARIIGSLGSTTVVLVAFVVWTAAVAAWLPVLLNPKRERFVTWHRSLTPLVVLLLIFAPIYLGLFATHMLPAGP